MNKAFTIATEAKKTIVGLVVTLMRRYVGFALSGNVRLAIAEDQDFEIEADKLNQTVYVLSEEDPYDETYGYHRLVRLSYKDGKATAIMEYPNEPDADDSMDFEDINIDDLVAIYTVLENTYKEFVEREGR